MTYSNIPIEFKIFGETIKIKQVKLLDDGKSLGEYQLNGENKIILATYEGNEESIEQTLWHETIHCLLDKMNYDDLNKDEVFVDLLAKCIHQIIKTSKYKKSKNILK